MLPHMTDPTGEHAKYAATKPGQAHWALPPDEARGRTCRECRFWAPSRHGAKRDRFGNLRRRWCQKFAALSFGQHGCGVPHDALICRHFEPANRVPKVEGRNTPKQKIAEAGNDACR